tara:strand:+ start:3958 stop:4647 length:690 start_codon:yes stop_codon:yes gene_type:complete
MKYYKISSSILKKEIGRYPQSVNNTSLGNLGNLGFKNEIIKDIILPKPELHSKSRKTSYLSITSIDNLRFLVINEAFTEFLEKNTMANFQTWNLEIIQSTTILNNYKLMYLPKSIENEIIDFSQSEFLIGKLGDWKDTSIRKSVEICNYKSYNELIGALRKRIDNSQIRCNKLTLNLSKINVDFFRLSNNPLLFGYFVSEKLKEAIELKSFSGMQFTEILEVDERINII